MIVTLRAGLVVAPAGLVGGRALLEGPGLDEDQVHRHPAAQVDDDRGLGVGRPGHPAEGDDQQQGGIAGQAHGTLRRVREGPMQAKAGSERVKRIGDVGHVSKHVQ